MIQIWWGPYNFWWYNTACGSVQCHALFSVSKTNDKFDRFISFSCYGHWCYNHIIFFRSCHYTKPIGVYQRSYFLKKGKGPTSLIVPLMFPVGIKDAVQQILIRLCVMSMKHCLSLCCNHTLKKHDPYIGLWDGCKMAGHAFTLIALIQCSERESWILTQENKERRISYQSSVCFTYLWL